MSYASLFAPSPFLDLPAEVWDNIFSFSHGEENKNQVYKRVFSVQKKREMDSVLPRQNRSMKENKFLPREEDLDLEVEPRRRRSRSKPFAKKAKHPLKKRIVKQKKIISHEENLYQQSLDDPHDYITDGPDDNFCDDYYDDLYKEHMSYYLSMSFVDYYEIEWASDDESHD
ncbi:Hypothetical protein BRZCDTV_312 [Brazilian cedratvirus IHUMI]|uniref:Uncharacterized protein n=1 Tax=Brazilian cedratvirus IHUMI TaxID=2126980 RepID=A0A2R8FEH1_9VIRU|nr:Hypothetical protein BRZCDTV_312 [Brazilian cedratvirus IHUMI]